MEKHAEGSQDCLLGPPSECGDNEPGGIGSRHTCSERSWLRTNAISLAILSLLVYIATLQTIGLSSKCPPWKDDVVGDEHLSLLRGVVKYEVRPEWLQPQYPWHQEPSDALDAVWDDLLYPLNVRIRKDELSLLKENTTNRVQITGGNGDDYVGVIGVYHHLHCLNNIRRLLSWDYYGPSMAGEKHIEGFSVEHSQHCIDTIRQALMCHANIGLYTSEWDEETHMPSRSLETNSVTTCVRWDSVNDWARQRALRPGQYKYKRPHLPS
ncbi:hypothetical protein GGS23DRAFT_606346 [Durotheca rogersii]|uniref:uncharacterized protein n=1 Tax=Durotheca rogersii TaxID=419775 RepID=UPI00221F059E|nr:uncharacterized protein GGS23DRAFT_606346 [Durotheca rogersii]KAI5861117.1 hypothetical protein GGS23DRAFT_606346 [Durotheca rogersii]